MTEKVSDEQLRIEAAKHNKAELNLEIGFIENKGASALELIEISLIGDKGLTNQN